MPEVPGAAPAAAHGRKPRSALGLASLIVSAIGLFVILAPIGIVLLTPSLGILLWAFAVFYVFAAWIPPLGLALGIMALVSAVRRRHSLVLPIVGASLGLLGTLYAAFHFWLSYMWATPAGGAVCVICMMFGLLVAGYVIFDKKNAEYIPEDIPDRLRPR